MREFIIIERLENHIKKARESVIKDLDNYFFFNSLSMDCFQAINNLIDLGGYIVTKNKLGFPSTYGEIFEILEKNKYLNKKELSVFKRLVFLRNLIAHEYYEISKEDIREVVNLFDSLEKFIEKIKDSLRK